MPAYSYSSRWVSRNRLARRSGWCVAISRPYCERCSGLPIDRRCSLPMEPLLSDERLPLVVLDMRKLKTLEGRVLAHGEEDDGKNAGRHYLLLEGTDAQGAPDLLHARDGRSAEPGTTSSRTRSSGCRSSLRMDDLRWRSNHSADAERVIRNKRHFGDKARSLVSRGLAPVDEGWGGWLGRYQAAMKDAVDELNTAQARTEPGPDR